MRLPAYAGRHPALPAQAADEHRFAPLFYTALLVFAGYFLGAELGLALTFGANPISVLWPPNAILFAALLLTTPSRWWVVLLAAFAAHLLAELRGGIPLTMALSWFVSNVSEALIGAICVRGALRRPLTFDRLSDVVVFIGSALVATFVSSFIDSALVVLNHWGTSTYWQLWQTRFASNVVASMTLVPVIVVWATHGVASLRTADRGQVIEASVLAVTLLTITQAVFNSPAWSSGGPALLYVPLPLLLWAALRFGPVGAATSLTLVAFVVIWGTGHGMGPLAMHLATESALSVQLFLMFVAPSVLMLAAVLEERRTAEQTLRESRERLRLALEGGRIGVWDWDPRSDATTWSQEQFAIMGFEPGSVEPSRDLWARSVHPDDLPHAKDVIERAMKEQAEYGCEYRIVRPDGMVRWVEARGKPLYDGHGDCCRVMGLMVDITERRHTEDLNQKLVHASRFAAMGELTASIAHELNQPMSAILSNVDAAEMLLDSGHAYDGELRQILDDIRNDDLRASEVIRHVRSLAKTHKAELQRFDLNELVASVVRLAWPRVQRQRVVVTAHCADVPAVHADRIHVQQVLLNLIFNAIDAVADAPGRRRGVTVSTTDVGNGFVEIAVGDSGPGIPVEQRERIFEPFYTTKKDGMGLGLSIARTLVDAQGGRIWAEANRPNGAVVRFTLRAYPATDERFEAGDAA
jgi:PAS domain S-box-containing protein